MKYICDHERTKQTLQTWAGQEQLYTASYFFWNAGTTMQKSQLGLLQSLLYRVLRSNPELIPCVCSGHKGLEPWDVAELLKVFGRLADQTALSARFCFFIDGLDEYDGKEEEIIRVLEHLAVSPHIKLCVSSRPWPAFEAHFGQNDRMLILEDLTMDDMKKYLKNMLAENDKFKDLAKEDPRCYDIVPQIVERAKGVWLWVYLVVRDLLEDLRDKETYKHLETRLNAFPPELKAYFADIMRRIDPIYQEETAQIFLIAVEAVQRPLPVIALNFLESQSNDPDYALNAKIEPIKDDIAFQIYETWRTKLKRRCRDLIKVNVDKSADDCFFKYKVDFLHRTVRDFLRDNHQAELRKQTPQDFDAKISLCRMMLALLKRRPISNLFLTNLNLRIDLVDEFLYYEYYLEHSDKPQPQFALLDELDRVNSLYAADEHHHWTNPRGMPTDGVIEIFIEGGQSSFLGLAVQVHLRLYVEDKLDRDPSLLATNLGRPLLDYALRPKGFTPVFIPSEHYVRREYLPVDTDMVAMLLDQGADPNQKVRIYNGQTTWGMFLCSCYENAQGASPAIKNAWYGAAKLLIERKADPNLRLVTADHATVSVGDILDTVLSPNQAARLTDRMREIQKAERHQSRSLRFWSWFK